MTVLERFFFFFAFMLIIFHFFFSWRFSRLFDHLEINCDILAPSTSPTNQNLNSYVLEIIAKGKKSIRQNFQPGSNLNFNSFSVFHSCTLQIVKNKLRVPGCEKSFIFRFRNFDWKVCVIFNKYVSIPHIFSKLY